MLPLEVLELRAVGVVWRLAVRDGERGLPDPRVEAERMLEPCGAALAEETRALFAIALELGPADACRVARCERPHAEEPRDVRRDPDPGEGAAVPAQLVDAQRGDDLLDTLAERLDDIRGSVRVARRDRVLEQEIRRERVRTEPERDHDVVEVADARGREHESAVAAKRAGA